MAEGQKIAIASDHAGFQLKAAVIAHLQKSGHTVIDLGPANEDRVDYPDFGFKLAESLRAGEAPLGIAICGSGIGISVAVNRYKDMRCALVHDATSARLARSHNDANVLALGARLIGPEVAIECVNVFLSTAFEGGRHADRLQKLGKCGA
ncbi:MAG TPA: ribose 5-phosphate isomerase B [Patescibacteria group bacterium]|nr:ribose 5-phosphate isomerase B [Patescibacteria group bacterium]